MQNLLVVVLFLGVWLGFGLGRWNAEGKRARFDMWRIWDGRTTYRTTKRRSVRRGRRTR